MVFAGGTLACWALPRQSIHGEHRQESSWKVRGKWGRGVALCDPGWCVM